MIAVYGRSEPGSFASVTMGWMEGLSKIADDTCDDDFTPRLVTRTDNLQQSMQAPEEMAVVTDPFMLPIARVFDHAKYFLVIAPHSEFLPDVYVDLIEAVDPVLLPPSDFCAGLLRRMDISGKIWVAQHGVSKDFAPLAQQEAKRFESTRNKMRGPGTNFLHLATGSLDRKSTVSVIDAFTMAVNGGLDATLTCVIPGQDRARLATQCIRDQHLMGRIQLLPRVKANPSTMRFFYSAFDAIVQPSRVEGFGMCPLEALCCGVPAIVTEGTGHHQWLQVSDAGVVTVPLGPPGKMELEPNECPTVAVEAIRRSMEKMHWDYSEMREAAGASIGKRREAFDWASSVEMAW